ncbi:hypothetical protein [Brevibacterium sp.]|uniref:hypothetical protein n=1 Tax=Brevibacterium sp. TaxID=1701 RepID=UPI0025BC8355|nr:hypothetical protein [Brevibacterium sp.]
MIRFDPSREAVQLPELVGPNARFARKARVRVAQLDDGTRGVALVSAPLVLAVPTETARAWADALHDAADAADFYHEKDNTP